MKVLIQRVNQANVLVDNETVGQIGAGLLIFLGVTQGDSEADVDYLVNKIVNLRIFERGERHFDVSLLDTNGEILVVPQFTLYGNCENGRRPDFISAAEPAFAEGLYKKFVQGLRALNIKTETGVFGAYMKVILENDGPATFILESNKL